METWVPQNFSHGIHTIFSSYYPSYYPQLLFFFKSCIMIQAQMGEVVTLNMKGKNVSILLT